MTSTGRTSGSRHFSVDELKCKHCGACFVVDELLALLERIRLAIGKPLPLRSAYRCPQHNHDVGGAANSQHVYGTAADLPTGLVPVEVAAKAGASGIGIKGGYALHVDVRRGGSARWLY